MKKFLIIVFAIWVGAVSFIILFPSFFIWFVDADTKLASYYPMVVTDTLAGLSGEFLAALVAYGFVNAGATILDNVNRMKKGDSPQPILFFWQNPK